MLFNRDITRFFKRLPAKSEPEFKTRLRERVLAVGGAQQRKASPLFIGIRSLGFALAVFTLFALGTATMLKPGASNTVLAEAIHNTFGSWEDGYRHLKIKEYIYQSNPEFPAYDAVVEYWQDTDRAIIELTNVNPEQQLADLPVFESQYIASDTNTVCSTAILAHHENLPRNISCGSTDSYLESKKQNEMHNASSLKVSDVRIEPAQDTYGDLYFTWVTEKPLKTSSVSISDAGPYGYVGMQFMGTYSWIGEQGQQINRVTLDSENILQDPFRPGESIFLLQIHERNAEPEMPLGDDTNIIASSPVYKIDVSNYTVELVTDEWLAASRTAYQEAYLDRATSKEMIQQYYNSSFDFLTPLLTKGFGSHVVDEKREVVDGKKIRTMTYSMPLGGYQINDESARKAVVVMDDETRTITHLTFFNEDGMKLWDVEVLATEFAEEAPTGLFDLDTWKARVTAK